MNSKIFRQELPKLYHLNNNEIDSTVIKKEDKITTRKLIQLSPICTSKSVDTSESNQIKSEKLEFDEKSEMNKIENMQESKDLKESKEGDAFKKPDELSQATLLDAINELKSHKSRITKMSVEKVLAKRNTNLSKNEITEFITKCLNDEIIEKVKYRDYYGLRLKAAFKKTQIVEEEQEEEEETSETNEELSQNDQTNDKESNTDNLSECSSVNNLTEELDEETDSAYNTKKNALKRCSPTIRYLLRTSTDNGVSAADILKSLQSKRLLVLYDVKKFTWLMKTFFVDKGVCEIMANGNYKLIKDNDDEESNVQVKAEEMKKPETNDKVEKVETDQIDLLADEKLEDEETIENKMEVVNVDNENELIERLNRTSNHLKVNMIYETIDKIDKSSKNFNLDNILKELDQSELTSAELAAFLVDCSKHSLLKRYAPSCIEPILNSIKRSKVLEEFELDDIAYKKVIAALKDLLKTNQLNADKMLSSLQSKNDLLLNYNLVLFNKLITDRLVNDGILKEQSDLTFKLLSEYNDETSNASDQSASMNSENNPSFVVSSATSFEMLNTRDFYKRKVEDDHFQSSKNNLESLRRPTSQRKKIKKSLGPDFVSLDTGTGSKNQKLRNAVDDKCEICFKSADKLSIIDCKRCKFKAHRNCLSKIDLAFSKSLKNFECELCRAKCCFCKEETEELISKVLLTCKKCNQSYHLNCFLSKSDIDKWSKNCVVCEKVYLKYLGNKEEEKLQSDKQSNLEIDLCEASSNDINVRSDILKEVPTLTQLKEIDKLTNSDNILNASRSKSESNSVNDDLNEDSNQSGAVSSLVSSNSNLENSKIDTTSTREETKREKYGRFFKAYDVHQKFEITKEQFKTLKSLNSYSNGKHPEDWTTDDVASFITSIGFPEQSTVFKQEEIDGKSLLLLRRNDVLTGLSLRLGPALKIYSHIYKLQGSN